MNEKIIINSGDESLEIKHKDNIPNDLRNKAIKSTINLLNTENIDHIIYIDDKFDVDGQKEFYKARLTELKDKKDFIQGDKFSSIDWDAPIPRFEILISNLWEETESKSELLSEICTHFKNEESANIIPALEIKNCYGDKIKLMTPDDWLTDKYEIIKNLEPSKKALCLFDFEFQNGNSLTNGRNGAQLAKSLIDENDYTDKVICGIFSHKFTEEEEDEFREKYSNDYGIAKSKFYTISKRRFAFDPQIAGFAEGIKNLLLLPYIEQLKEESLNILEQSNKRAGEKIKKMSPKTFNQIIQKSSLKEGVWEISTLFRLYGILSKEENFNSISDTKFRAKFNDSIKRIRNIDKENTGYISKTPNQQLIDLRNSELYLSGNFINKLHLPLTNGDIFKIKNKEYILLVQPCNLALRAGDGFCGKRGYSYNVGMLIPIKSIPKEKLNITTEQVKVAKTSDEIDVAYFPGFLTISLDFLDLSVFNDEGKASINFEKSTIDNELIHFPWIERYKNIHKSLLYLEKKIVEFNTIKKAVNAGIKDKRLVLKVAKETQKTIIEEEIKILTDHLSNTEKSVLSVGDLAKFKIDCNKIYNSKSRILDTGIKRDRHYKSPYSDDLLQKFMLYLSRNAFEHDFTS